MTAPLVVGIDLGGTNLKIALVDRGGNMTAQRSIPTAPARGPQAVVADFVRVATELLHEKGLNWADVVGVGVASPGPLDLSAGRIIKAANLPGWVDVPLRDIVADGTSRPTVLENDGNAAAFGEYWAGTLEERITPLAPEVPSPEPRASARANPQAGWPTSSEVGESIQPQTHPAPNKVPSQGFVRAINHRESDLVLLTLGTGIGAGVVMDGRIVHGALDNAAELGHMIVAVNGLPCPCGQRGCLEQYASAAAVGRRVAEAIRDGATSSLPATMQHGESIDSAQVARAAQSGDALAARIWDEACLYLAVAIINIQHAYNPSVVLLGGGMSGAGDFLLHGVRRHLENQRWSLHNDLPDVRLARLGNDAGVIGAAGLAWIDIPNAQHGRADPTRR